MKAEVDADSADEAIKKIRAQGYFPTKVKEKAGKKSGAAKGGKAKQEEAQPIQTKRKMLRKRRFCAPTVG